MFAGDCRVINNLVTIVAATEQITNQHRVKSVLLRVIADRQQKGSGFCYFYGIDLGDFFPVARNSQYKRLLQDSPHSATQLLTHLAVTLAERLRITDGLYLDTVFLEVPARLAKFLLKLSSPTTDSSSGERLLDIVLSQYEMGTLINASRESVNKQLRDWESSGVIEMNRGRTIILDSGFLQEKSMGQEVGL